MPKTFLILGSINSFLAVALGAFGAHGLRDKIAPELFQVYETGVHYHMYHALALVLVGLIAHYLMENAWIHWAGYLFLAGIVLFSGSLYVLSITGIRTLGAITPFGGLAFLAGWLLLALAVWKG